MPTDLPSSVSAAARFEVSVDLPTPPLPDPMHRTWPTWASAPAGIEPRPSVFCSAAFSVSDRTSKATVDRADAGDRAGLARDRLGEVLRIGQPAVVSETVTCDVAAVGDVDRAHHAELDDRAAQLRVDDALRALRISSCVGMPSSLGNAAARVS